MNINKTILAIGFVAITTTAYLAGYQDGAEDIAKDLHPRITELQAKNDKRLELFKEVRHLGQQINGLTLQLERPVTLYSPGVSFDRDTRVAKFVISAYSPYDDRNYINSDGSPNDTATGTKPKPGTFAVDPTVIPYGSKVTIMYPDGTMEHGVAEDTGGAIKHNRIDVFRYSFDTAMQFGKKEAIVIWGK